LGTQNAQAKDFFNRIAGSYKDKYGEQNAFHHYFFNERLAKASEGFDFEGAKVLDIGTGTGDLYDHLKSINPEVDFYGTDIAENMMAQSNIPENRRFVGRAGELKIPEHDFDYVYMLGVTTYLPQDEMKATLDFIAEKLKPEGKAILTFTYSLSFDNFTRTALKLPIRLIKAKGAVMGQGFKIYKYSIEEAKKLVEPKFDVKEVRYLNHTVFPFNLLFKKASVRNARKIDQKKEGWWLRRMSYDIMIVMEKKG
jgi:ubiquinone/menaquinone biosynthesis C-methylase UbiE